MRREIRDQWTAALRSGEYQQATSYLHTERGYCCLGVLCDLAVKAGVVSEPRLEGPDYDGGPMFYTYGVDSHRNSTLSSYTALPSEVQDWAGIDEDYGDEVHLVKDWYEQDSPQSLATMNDNGASFAEIADKIEEFL